MAESEIWTAEELETLAPGERQSVVRASFTKDLGQVPPELLDRARARIAERIAASRDVTTPDS